MAKLCTWNILFHSHCTDAEYAAEKEVDLDLDDIDQVKVHEFSVTEQGLAYHQWVFSPNAIKHNVGQKVSTQLDAAPNHKVEVSVAAQVGDGIRNSVV